MINLSYKDIESAVDQLAFKIAETKYKNFYGVPRGGVPIALMLGSKLNVPITDKITKDTLIVDDLSDSGMTLRQYKDNDTAVAYVKAHAPEPTYWGVQTPSDEWLTFPYEETESDIESNVIRILEYIGEDPTREGLLETPKRYIKFLKQFTEKEEFNFTVFEAEGYDEMIVQKDIPFFSLCEHHIAPFFGTATVAYIPTDKIVGLSKLARTVHHYARQLQNQERITNQIAERLIEELKPAGVAVTLSARHFCMEMRGVKTHDVHTITTKVTGAFKDKPETRAEYMTNLTR